MAKAGQTERANQAFQLALQVAQKIEERIGSFCRCLQASPPAIAKAGQTERANQAFQLALQVAQED
jgi:hypothetical protein